MNTPSIQNYDPISKRYADYIGTSLTEWSLGYSSVLRELGEIQERKVLDFGCGGGNFSVCLAEQGAQVTGVDTSAEMVACAQLRGSARVGFYHITADQELDRLGCDFDAATANFVLCTYDSLERITESCRRVYETLRAGGKFIVLNVNWERCNGADFASFKLHRVDSLERGMPIAVTLKHGDGIKLFDFFWPIEDYKNAMLAAGFARAHVIEIGPSTRHPEFIDERKVSPFYLLVGEK